MLLFLTVNSIFAISTELDITVKNFKNISYNASGKNWNMASTSDGIIYFANHQGLLEFDGTSWRLYSLPNQTVMRAVSISNDSVIFTSGYMEMGYWKRDSYGSLNYFSLNKKAKKYFNENIEFWNIASKKNTIYFQSFNQILAYRADSIQPVILSGFITVLNKVGTKILAAVRDEGIYSIEKNKAVPYVEGDFFKGKTINFLLEYTDNEILIGTASKGIFVWNGKSFKQWNTEWTDYFSKNALNRGHCTKDGWLIFGTLRDGVVVFDKNGRLLHRVNNEIGLNNNTVLAISSDVWNNVWLALDDGIAYISTKVDRSVEIERIPGIGQIYTTATVNNTIYLGTNQGLYIKSLNNKSATAALIPGTQGQIWDCKIIDNQLWCGHNSGTFLVEGLNAKLVSQKSGGFDITKDAKNNNQLLQCTYSDLVKYNFSTDNSVESKTISGFNNLIRYIETDHLGNIWASQRYKGIYKIRTDEYRERVTDVKYFGESTFGKEFLVHVFKVENRIVFTTGTQLFTYDDLSDTIVPYDLYNEKLGVFANAHRIVTAPNHYYWFICKNTIGLFKIQNVEISKIKEFPISVFNDFSLVDNFENIEPLSEKKAILSLKNGIAYLDASVRDTVLLMNHFTPSLRNFIIYNNKREQINQPLVKEGIKIKYNSNNVLMRFSFPRLNEFSIAFHYKLEGLNTEWSERILQPEFRFERLPKGNYTLKTKAIDPWGNESRITEIHFEVLPPIYASEIAIVIYIIIVVAVLLGFRSWGIKQTRKKEQRQHEKQEKELIQLRNEKLRNEIQHKSKELANSTMSIIKKNEFLLDLKENITKQKNELGSRYPDKYYNHLNKKIDDNISNQEDWKVFETNFERAHEQFYIKIKELYPELTSSDLRLCAFLRMNLSSKDIAPLLGISVRGVENHRYRLRKKMNLQHDDSLTNTILTL